MHTATTTLPPEPASARLCRLFLVQTLESWGADSFADDAVLLSSELVTNAVLHAGTPIQVRVTLDGGHLRVEVHDGSPRLPAVRHYSLLSGTGRGLAMVAEMAAAWAIEPTGHGKAVWFELVGADG